MSLSTRKLGPPQAPTFKFDNKEKVLVSPQVVRLIIQEYAETKVLKELKQNAVLFSRRGLGLRLSFSFLGEARRERPAAGATFKEVDLGDF